jgi:hypothetical protein
MAFELEAISCAGSMRSSQDLLDGVYVPRFPATHQAAQQRSISPLWGAEFALEVSGRRVIFI